MATAAALLDWKCVEQEESEAKPAQVTTWEDTPRGARRLLEAQRRDIEAETARAKSLLDQFEMDAGEIYSEETLDRAVAFLKAHIESAWQLHGIKAPMPTIGPGPRGSVDLYWEQPSWKLLVNMPADKNISATFYGDDYGRQKTKGSVDPSKVSITIIAWLKA